MFTASQKKTLALLVFIIAVVLGLVMWQPKTEPSTKFAGVRLTAAKSSVHALGRLEPRGTVVRVSPPSGNDGACISELKVSEGTEVKAGQVLAVLDTFERRRCALMEAEANSVAAIAKLSQIEAGTKRGDIAAAQASRDLANEQMRVTKRELDRAQKLLASNSVSEEEFDSRRWAFERASHDVHRFQGMLDSAQEIRATDVAAQRAMIAVAEAAIATAKSNLEATRVLAPLDSRVLKIHSWPGEKPSDKGLCDVGCVTSMQAVAEVYEGDIAFIELGQRTRILIETLGKQLDGTVVEIGQMVARKVVLTNDPVSDTDARVVEVRIDIAPHQMQAVSRLSNARIQVHFPLGTQSTIQADKAGDRE